MSSVTPTKRIKLSKENDLKKNNIKAAAESGFHSEIDISSSISDFSLPPVKRKSLAPRRASLQQISLNSITDHTQQSSGYSSLYSSSSNITTTDSASTRTSRTPKKRKSEISESDENFYNSFQFVSPVKIRKKDPTDKNCAKLILKEKSCSENVILCSTPIRTNNKNTKWGKFRSFHPEKFQADRKSLDDVEPLEKIPCTPPIKSLAESSSLNLSTLDFSNLSAGNFTHSIQQDIPANLQNLWTDDIKPTKNVTFNTTESQVKTFSKSTINTSKYSERKKFFNGRTKFDILGSLHAQNNIAVAEILNYFDAKTLLSLSHVCKNYKHMIQTNKNYETKRINYLKLHRSTKENKLPSIHKALSTTTENENISNVSVPEKKKKKAFGNYNINLNLTKQKTLPQSPSTRRYQDLQKLKQSSKTRCPRCHKSATINSIKIRNSPRKKKASNNIYKLSQSATGRVQKRTRATFLSKTSIPESFHEATLNPQYVTLSCFNDELSRSPNRSSSCDSPNSSGSDDSFEIDEIYEYGLCDGIGCSYKFCVKCNCKYHPKQICGDLSPPSPSRQTNKSKILAGSKASRKSLKRLNY